MSNEKKYIFKWRNKLTGEERRIWWRLFLKSEFDQQVAKMKRQEIGFFKYWLLPVEDAEDVDFICPACGKDTRLGGQCSWCLMREE